MLTGIQRVEQGVSRNPKPAGDGQVKTGHLSSFRAAREPEETILTFVQSCFIQQLVIFSLRRKS
jgi:hypothetical protein